jgi:hypothetical protein
VLKEAADRNRRNVAVGGASTGQGEADVDERRAAQGTTSGIGVQTDSEVSPFGSGRSVPPVIRTW